MSIVMRMKKLAAGTSALALAFTLTLVLTLSACPTDEESDKNALSDGEHYVVLEGEAGVTYTNARVTKVDGKTLSEGGKTSAATVLQSTKTIDGESTPVFTVTANEPLHMISVGATITDGNGNTSLTEWTDIEIDARGRFPVSPSSYNKSTTPTGSTCKLGLPQGIAEFTSVTGIREGSSYNYSSGSYVTTTVSAVKTSNSIITHTITGEGSVWQNGGSDGITITAKDSAGNTGVLGLSFSVESGKWEYMPYISSNLSLTNTKVYKLGLPQGIAEFTSVYSNTAMGTARVTAEKTSSSIITLTITGTGNVYSLNTIIIMAKDSLGNTGTLGVGGEVYEGEWSGIPWIDDDLTPLVATATDWYVGLPASFSGAAFKDIDGDTLTNNSVTAAYTSGTKITLTSSGRASGSFSVVVGAYYKDTNYLFTIEGYLDEGKFSTYAPSITNYTSVTPVFTPQASLTVSAPSGYTFASIAGEVLTAGSNASAAASYSGGGKSVTITLGTSAESADGLIFGLKDAAGNSYLTDALSGTSSSISGGKWTDQDAVSSYTLLYNKTLVPAATVYFLASDIYSYYTNYTSLSSLTAAGSSDVTRFTAKIEGNKLAVTVQQPSSTGYISGYSSVRIKVVGENYLGNLFQYTLGNFGVSLTGVGESETLKITNLGYVLSSSSATYIPRSVR